MSTLIVDEISESKIQTLRNSCLHTISLDLSSVTPSTHFLIVIAPKHSGLVDKSLFTMHRRSFAFLLDHFEMETGSCDDCLA